MTLRLLSVVFAAGLVLSLTSCVPMDPYYDGGSGPVGYSPRPMYSSPGYSSYYNDDDFYYYDGSPSPSYYGRPYGSYTMGYSYYRGHSTCPICHHSPCTGHSGRSSSWRSSSSHSYSSYSHRDNDHDHDDHHSGGGQTLYRRVGNGPTGEHTKEWFTSRGYAASRLVKADDDDHHKKSSGNSKDHDHDDKKHKH